MNTAHLANEVLRTCLENIRLFLGKTVIVHRQEIGAMEADFTLTLPTNPPIKWVGECKTNIATRGQAMNALHQARAYAGKNANVLLAAKWIPEVVAEELRKEGVDFVDTVGNAYIWHPPRILIDIRGKRPEARLAPEPGRLVEVGGLKVCHLLLTQPRFLEAPLRTIAREAGVALATAHAVVRELKLARLLLPGPGGKRRLGDTKNMVETFVRGYAMKLRPACLIGRYRHRNNHPEQVLTAFQARFNGTTARWALTGGFAAKKLTGYLEPDTLAVFVDEKAEEQLKQEPMLPDRNGNVILLRLFAPHAIAAHEPQDIPLATPLLVYAELLNDGGPRELETAQMLYQKGLLPEVIGG